MKVNKITGFSAQDQDNTSVTLQYNSSDKLSTTETGVTVHENVGIGSFLIFDGGTPASDALTVTSNEITVTRSYHTVDTSGGTETLKTIKVGAGSSTLGQIVILRGNSSNNLTIDDTDYILVNGSWSVLWDDNDHIMFI